MELLYMLLMLIFAKNKNSVNQVYFIKYFQVFERDNPFKKFVQDSFQKKYHPPALTLIFDDLHIRKKRIHLGFKWI